MIKKYLLLVAVGFLAATSFGQTNNENRLPGLKKITIGFTDSIQSSILGETRAINIYLPEDYHPDSAATYPVIYLLDGGIDEDFIHIAGIVRFNTTPWLERFPKSIVVGIENVNRRRDFTFATENLDFVSKMGFDKNAFKQHGGSAKFISFIENELQPFMKTHYKTNDSKTIIGESLGGLLVSEILLKKPALFDTYIIVSPSLWWGAESLLAEPTALSKETFTQKLDVYIGAANKAEDIVMYNDAESLSAKIKKIGKKNINLYFDHIIHEAHASIIHQAVYNAFTLIYPIKH